MVEVWTEANWPTSCAAAVPDSPLPTWGWRRARGEEFSALWDTHHVAVRRADIKRFLHPVVGLLELDCEVLLNPEHDQRLIVYTARPGSKSYEGLELLRVVGLQNLTRG